MSLRDIKNLYYPDTPEEWSQIGSAVNRLGIMMTGIGAFQEKFLWGFSIFGVYVGRPWGKRVLQNLHQKEGQERRNTNTMKTKAEIVQKLLDEKKIDAEEAVILLMGETSQVIISQPYPVYPSPIPFYTSYPNWPIISVGTGTSNCSSGSANATFNN